MTKLKLFTTIKDCRIYFNPKQKKSMIEFSKDQNGKDIVVDIRIVKDKRSLSQNNYIWGLYDIIADYTGHSSWEIHCYCKDEFIHQIPGVDVREINIIDKFIKMMKIGGEIMELTTTKLNTVQCVAYTDLIRMFFREQMDLYLPLPDEFGKYV